MGHHHTSTGTADPGRHLSPPTRGHIHTHASNAPDASHDESGLADLLDLDGRVHAALLDDLTALAAGHAPRPRTVVDLGAGSGTGTLALARRFPAAEILAVDVSPVMLTRVRAAAERADVSDRVRTVEADLDAGWPDVGQVDLVWAASSLHHVADPDRVLRGVHDALRPGGVAVVVELEGMPRFLPDDAGPGRPGLESRCHDAMASAGWNAHPDWHESLERAGLDVVEQRTLATSPEPSPASARYAHETLRRVREALGDRLAADDLAALDALLAEDGPHSLLHRAVHVRGRRTVWVARRPARASHPSQPTQPSHPLQPSHPEAGSR